jgi:glycosyltransferase involved in cell wall biosynthesis
MVMNKFSQGNQRNEVCDALRPSLPEVTISVVVPVYNGGEAFRQCLMSLTALNPPPMEVIVVADGDTDGSWQMAEEFGAQVIDSRPHRADRHGLET